MGADFTVNYKTDPDWGATVRNWTDKRGVDNTLEIGGPGSLAQSINATRVGGHIALIGIMSGLKGEVPTMTLMAKQITLKGLIVGSRAQQLDMIRKLEATGIRPVIDKVFPLAALADAFRYEESAQHMGKICVEI
jgi:NADPH:quinone reductase-like Zn-dependent oxidoreductase